MKNWSFLLMLGLPALASAQSGKYIVQGKLGSYNAPARVYLEYSREGKTVIDSALLKEGKFSFSGSVESPKMAYLLLSKTAGGANKFADYKSFYLENGTIEIQGADSVSKAKLTGPKTNQEQQRYDAALKEVNDAYAALEAKQKAATPEQKQSEAFAKENNLTEKAIELKEAQINKQFIKDNPDSYISLNALEMVAYMADYSEVKPLYDGLTPAIKQSESGKKFAELLPKMKAVAIGASAPEFTENDTLGKPVSLTSFKGKYVLLDFWASWCGPCRQENPNVVRAFNKYKDKNFTILSVSLDRPNGRDRWLKAIHNDHLTWNHVSDLQFWKSKVAGMYGVRGIPQNFLLDPNGKIIAKNLRGEDLNDKLSQLFNNTSSTN